MSYIRSIPGIKLSGKYIIGLIAVLSIVACLVISIIKKDIYKALSALSYKILTVLVFC